MPTREELKAYVIQYLSEKAATDRVGQLNDLVTRFTKAFGQQPEEADKLVMLEVAHEAMLAGVVVFARDLGQGYPWLRITDFGASSLGERKFLPYDPGGFISSVKADLPQLDPVCLRYLNEAVHAYSKSLLLSASVMLGVASEGLMLRVIKAFSGWKEVQATFAQKIHGKAIFEQYTELRKRLDPKLDLLDAGLRKDLETYLDGLFNFIRVIRNAAGHPTDTEIRANVVHANLQAFPAYAKRLLALVDFFDSQKHP